jgi:phage baseplate assembly protein W
MTTTPSPSAPTSAAVLSGALLYGRGVSFPFRVSPTGSIVWSDGELNVRESLCTILRTRRGERLERPDFGCRLDELLFEPNSVATLRLVQEEVSRAVARWEPRVVLDGVVATVDPDDPRAVDVALGYTLVATGGRERLQLTISPDGAPGQTSDPEGSAP